MSAMDYAVQSRAPRSRTALVVMALAALVFVGSAAVKPGQALPTDPVAAAVEPVSAAIESNPDVLVPGDIAQAAAQGAGDAAQEASPIDWAMIGSALTFLFTGLGAISGLVFGWRNDHRKERLAALRERELELEIARLRAVGGC
eukprot:gene17422-17250_t